MSDASDTVVAVVTVVHGRHEHLRAQRAALVDCVPRPALHVVVAVADDVDAVIEATPGIPTDLVSTPGTLAGLPIAAARNAGARAALSRGAGTVIFLDVDCIPSASLVGDYIAALAQRPDAIVCGPVTYLPPAPETGWTTDGLLAARSPHPARPDPSPGTFAHIGPALFWSLSFAVRAATWHRVGGFYEGYTGYGGEDTDLGFVAADRGVDLLFYGGADAFHQHHPVNDPPVEHLDDIVRNSGVFRRRHGVTPMTGWLSAFREAGLVVDTTNGPRRSDAMRVLTVPARHRYLDAVLPPTVERVRTDRVVAWEPDPLLVADAFAAVSDEVDVVHVHFSYEHLEFDALGRWLKGLDQRRVPLVLTVHDLHNPHLEDQQRHLGQLAMLASRAARIVTLTPKAAARCSELFGRRVDIVAHPTLLDTVPAVVAARRDAVLVPLKSLRANVIEPVRIVETVAAAAPHTRVLLDPAAGTKPGFEALLALDGHDGVEVVLAGHVPHDEIVGEVAAARALLLPYAFGTHSGWIELARDVGTAVIAPDCGAYADQWDAVRLFTGDASLASAVSAAFASQPPRPADPQARLAQRDAVRASHEAIYRAVLDR